VEAFLAKDSQLRLMLYAENGRDYAASLQPPGKYKKKAMFFVKMESCTLTPENIAEKVTYGDTGDAPLETLSAVAQNVFLPLLTSPNNQVGWPEVLSKEVSDSLHKFTANIFVTIGQAKGHTMLPLPAGMSSLFSVKNEYLCVGRASHRLRCEPFLNQSIGIWVFKRFGGPCSIPKDFLIQVLGNKCVLAPSVVKLEKSIQLHGSCYGVQFPS
jgi:hypothetical protein